MNDYPPSRPLPPPFRQPGSPEYEKPHGTSTAGKYFHSQTCRHHRCLLATVRTSIQRALQHPDIAGIPIPLLFATYCMHGMYPTSCSTPSEIAGIQTPSCLLLRVYTIFTCLLIYTIRAVQLYPEINQTPPPKTASCCYHTSN